MKGKKTSKKDVLMALSAVLAATCLIAIMAACVKAERKKLVGNIYEKDITHPIKVQNS